MLASGLPVVAYDLPVFRELFSKSFNGAFQSTLEGAEQISNGWNSTRGFELGRKGASFVRFLIIAVANHECFLSTNLEGLPNEPLCFGEDVIG